MVTIGVIGLLCGVLLGIRFKVYALVPAHGVAVLVAGFAAWLAHSSGRHIGLLLVIWSVGSNMGYVLGAVARASRRRIRARVALVVPPPPQGHR